MAMLNNQRDLPFGKHTKKPWKDPPFLIGKSPCLIGKSAFLMGKSLTFMETDGG